MIDTTNSTPSNTQVSPSAAEADLAGSSVRELLASLSHIEDSLRSLPFLVASDGLMVVNPDVSPLLARQRMIVAQLRARRVSWRNGSVARPRQSSASWPRPPWS
jgi:hypothetical protein